MSAEKVFNADISIHAPTRGATHPRMQGIDQKEFQSTLPRGERLSRSLVVLYELLDFNPRSHEGSDCARRAVVSLMVYFNPRSHEGSDAITILCSI